ncbi:MAG: DNA-binding NarL/FixJ family response regulator [Methylophagaceae bacterium]|jgi:DNA-binding NarL/FixJ family response regulator
MAVTGPYIASVCMINVVIFSPISDMVKRALEEQSDIWLTELQPFDLDDVVAQVGHQHPDIFIITQDSEHLNGDILCHFLSKHYPTTQSLILVYEEPTFDMLRNSGFKARGYILKKQQAEIDKAVRAVHSGEAWLPRKLVAEMLNRFESQTILG